MRESVIERYLVKRVKEAGGEVRKVKWIGRRGAPDRVVMLPSRDLLTANPSVVRYVYPVTAWVELKAPGAKPEPHQAREHKRMRRMGQHVVVIDSFQQVDELLR